MTMNREIFSPTMLLRSEDVFDIYVEPYIQSGFRLPNQPYSYYYRSLFWLHNETLSIWIHLLGTVILLGTIFEHLLEISSQSNGKILCIYIVYNSLGACLMLLCSAQAHLFHSRTLADHLRSFYFDYFGMNFYGFTSGIVLRRFSHQTHFIDEFIYYFILTIISIYSLSIACFCKTFYRRPYPLSHRYLQCSGILFLYLYQILPVLKNLYLIYGNQLNTSEEKAFIWHLLQFLSFLLSGLIFIGKIPERFSPGLFDLFGQSHHAFHLTIFFMAYSQANAVFYDMHSINSNYIELFLFKDIFYTAVVFIAQLFIVLLWYRISRPTIEQRYELEIKKKKF